MHSSAVPRSTANRSRSPAFTPRPALQHRQHSRWCHSSSHPEQHASNALQKGSKTTAVCFLGKVINSDYYFLERRLRAAPCPWTGAKSLLWECWRMATAAGEIFPPVALLCCPSAASRANFHLVANKQHLHGDTGRGGSLAQGLFWPIPLFVLWPQPDSSPFLSFCSVS